MDQPLEFVLVVVDYFSVHYPTKVPPPGHSLSQSLLCPVSLHMHRTHLIFAHHTTLQQLYIHVGHAVIMSYKDSPV